MVEINNLTTILVDEKFLKKIAKKILKEEEKKDLELSIALVKPAKMRKLNKKYRGKNRATDVLAFGQAQRVKFIIPSGKKRELGEVVICLGEVKKNAKRFKSTFKVELARVLTHGLLHLLGYDHEKSAREAKKMEEKENYYLTRFL